MRPVTLAIARVAQLNSSAGSRAPCNIHKQRSGRTGAGLTGIEEGLKEPENFYKMRPVSNLWIFRGGFGQESVPNPYLSQS